MLSPATLGVSLKAYLGLAETEQWLTGIRDLTRPENLRMFVLPSYLAIGMALRLLADTGVQVGGQDVSPDDAGPWTGEVTAAVLAEAGAALAEMGHSERRQRHGETDAQVAAKVGRSLTAGLIPVLCTGEPERRSVRDAETIVRQQLAGRLAQARPGSELLIAYEPEWAIGGTEPADPGRIGAVTAMIRAVTREAGIGATVLYGGSADRGLFTTLCQVAGPGQCPDGLFLGRAALDIANLGALASELAQAPRPVAA